MSPCPFNHPVSPLAYGCWRFAGTGPDEARSKIVAALKAGLTLIDTADIYGLDGPGWGAAESLLGAVLKADPALRSQMTLATKGGIVLGAPYNSAPEAITAACDASLTRLGVDHVDLYQIHRPDLLTPFAELGPALDELVAKGKTKRIGISNFTAAQARALAAHMKEPIVSIQNEFSTFCQAPLTDGTLDWAQEVGAIFFAWSPLAGGAVVSNAEPSSPVASRVKETLDQLAGKYGVGRDAVAFAFLMALPGPVVPIVGTQNVGRIAALAEIPPPALGRRDTYDLIEAYRGAPMP